MPENVLVSVIIPCYNHGEYLHECIDSIKAQSYRNLEIIVVNDGSTDEETIHVLGEINDPLIKIITKENEGLAAARNTGIRNASGAIILPLDADDKIGTQYIEKAVDILVTQHEVTLVSCMGKYFGYQTALTDNHFAGKKQMLLYNSLFHSGIFRKKDFDAAGGYNINMNKGLEDWDLWIRLIQNKKVIQLPEVFFFYRQTESSMLHRLNRNEEDKILMENTLFKNNIDTYLQQWGSMIQVLRDYEMMKTHYESIQTAQAEIYNTRSYRLGSFVLSPFKFLKSRFKRK